MKRRNDGRRAPPSQRGWLARAALTAATLLAATPGTARGDEAMSDAEVTRRLDFIDDRLSRAEPAAARWWNLWYYGYLTVTVGEAGFAIIIKDKNLRETTAVGAAFSSVGVVGIGAFDFPARYAGSTLARLPAATSAERRRKLARAEALLATTAKSERVGRSFIPHVAGAGLALTSALVMGIAYKQVAAAIVTLVSGIGITEAQIFTRPTAAIDDWRQYKSGSFAASTPLLRGPSVQLGVAPHPGGMGLSLSF